jgi:predicted metal-dependent HD superfamily phosphohydrolase
LGTLPVTAQMRELAVDTNVVDMAVVTRDTVAADTAVNNGARHATHAAVTATCLVSVVMS